MRKLRHSHVLAALSLFAILAMLACGPSSDDLVSDQGVAEQSATPTAVAQIVATVPAEQSTLTPSPTRTPAIEPSPSVTQTPRPSPSPTPTPTPTATPEYSLVTSDPSQPDLIWRFEAPTELWGATVTDGVVLTSGDNNVVYALDAISGELLWELEDAGVSAAADGIAYLAVSGSAEDMKYDLTPKNRIHALDASTGELLWSHESFGLVAVTDGIVYAGSWDYDDSEQGILFALTASNGESLWEYEVEAPTMWPVASDGLVYLTTIEAVHALDAPTGSLLWRQEGTFGQLAAADGLVFVTALEYVTTADYEGWEENGLYALSAATGDILWKYEGTLDWLAAADGRVYASMWRLNLDYSEDSHFRSLSAAT